MGDEKKDGGKGNPPAAKHPLSGTYRKPLAERRQDVAVFSGLSPEAVQALESGQLPFETAERMVENVVSTYPVPLGVAANFIINGKELAIPMATEETSVVAAASNGARMCRSTGGFKAEIVSDLMIGQIHLVGVADPASAFEAVERDKPHLLELANSCDLFLRKLGGGARDLEVRVVKDDTVTDVIVHILVDTKDAMGANVVNTMAEKIAPELEKALKGEAVLRIVTNLADRRVASANATWPASELGEGVAEGIVQAWRIACIDEYRCATHNKGVMNGVTALVLATGNDTRAVESAAHSYAMRSGEARPLTSFRLVEGGLEGRIELPFPVGIVGGMTKLNPMAKASLEIIGARSARDLGMAMACLGLAQNLAALRALTTEGIQKGHMHLHAKNVALRIGATGPEVDALAQELRKAGRYDDDTARETLARLRAHVKV